MLTLMERKLEYLYRFQTKLTSEQVKLSGTKRGIKYDKGIKSVRKHKDPYRVCT